MNAINPKGKPIPVRFSETESQFIATAAKSTGLCHAELVRRAVRLMRRQQGEVGSLNFVLALT